MDSEFAKNISKYAGDLEESAESTNRKAGTSERCKMQMKWCEDQRRKLQKEFDQLKEAKLIGDKFMEHHLKESSKLLELKQSLLNELFSGNGSGPIPEGASTSDDDKSSNNDVDDESVEDLSSEDEDPKFTSGSRKD